MDGVGSRFRGPDRGGDAPGVATLRSPSGTSVPLRQPGLGTGSEVNDPPPAPQHRDRGSFGYRDKVWLRPHRPPYEAPATVAGRMTSVSRRDPGRTQRRGRTGGTPATVVSPGRGSPSNRGAAGLRSQRRASIGGGRDGSLGRVFRRSNQDRPRAGSREGFGPTGISPRSAARRPAPRLRPTATDDEPTSAQAAPPSGRGEWLCGHSPALEGPDPSPGRSPTDAEKPREGGGLRTKAPSGSSRLRCALSQPEQPGASSIKVTVLAGSGPVSRPRNGDAEIR